MSVRNQEPDSRENHPSYEEAAHEGKKRISTRKDTNAYSNKILILHFLKMKQVF